MADSSPGKEITWSSPGNPSQRVLVGQPVSSGKDKVTPLYDTGSGQFVGWQTSDGRNVQAGSTNGMAPMIYVPPKPAGQQQGAQDAGSGSAGQASASYLTGPGATSGGGPGGSGSIQSGANTMANTGFGPTISQDTGPMGTVTPEMARQFFVSSGGPAGIDDATAMAYFKAANPNYGRSGVSQQDAISYFIQQGGSPNIDPATAVSYYERAHPQELQAGVANAALTPEQRALQQIAKTDPASEALRTAVAGSYLSPLQQAAQGGPNAQQLQSYLDTYKQLDPQGFAQRQAMGQQVADFVTKVTGQAPKSQEDALAQYKQLDPQGYANMAALGGSMGDWLKQTTDQLNLGSQLDPVTARQVEQQTRLGQAARGNVYGTPQLVQEAMTTGQAGLALQQQRQAALQAATGGMQSYLGSGQTLGDRGNTLYQQGLANTQGALGLQQSYLQSGTGLGDTALSLYDRNMANLRAAQGSALSYLGSGQTPYAAGAGYLAGAEQTAAQAAQGGPQYNPASLGQSYQASQIPQYGLDTSQNVNQWYNSLSAYMNPGGAQKNKTGAALGGAASGALSGAATGATLGSAIPAVGTVVGAGVGALGGGLLGGGAGYFS